MTRTLYNKRAQTRTVEEERARKRAYYMANREHKRAQSREYYYKHVRCKKLQSDPMLMAAMAPLIQMAVAEALALAKQKDAAIE